MSTSESNCSLCRQLFPTNELLIIAKCDHISCGKCLVNYVTQNLKPRVKCPSESCQQFINDPILRKCLSKNQIDIYENLCVTGSSSNAKKCPIEQCPFLFIFEESFGVFICDYCESPICIACGDTHYPGICSISKEDKESIRENAMKAIRSRKREENRRNDARYDLLPNPEAYECSFCFEFILPGCGVTLRNCLDCFCRNCLQETYSNKNFINQMKCQKCNAKLENKELVVLIEEKRFTAMVKDEMMLLWFHCKKEDCVGVWDVLEGSKSHACHICNSVNCMDCCAIHTDMTCATYKTQSIYLESIEDMKTLTMKKHTNCHYCKRMLIQEKGCGALFCDNCGHHTCVFTGKIAGLHDVKACGCWNSKQCDKIYCECRSDKPCDIKCLYGCFPE